jgi:hypothetical protein
MKDILDIVKEKLYGECVRCGGRLTSDHVCQEIDKEIVQDLIEKIKGENMTEDTTIVEVSGTVGAKEKRGYRKVNKAVYEAVNNGARTLDEIVKATNVTKWYCKTVANQLIAKKKISLVDGNYFIDGETTPPTDEEVKFVATEVK